MTAGTLATVQLSKRNSISETLFEKDFAKRIHLVCASSSSACSLDSRTARGEPGHTQENARKLHGNQRAHRTR